MSLSSIKRHLRKKDLHRRPLPGRKARAIVLEYAIRQQLHGSGAKLGYRRIWAYLISIGTLGVLIFAGTNFRELLFL